MRNRGTNWSLRERTYCWATCFVSGTQLRDRPQLSQVIASWIGRKIIFIFEVAKLYRLAIIRIMHMSEIGQGQESRRTPCIETRGELMIVNGELISYCNQMLTNHNFFLADLGIDLPPDSGIDEFDRKYFDFMLISKIIAEIESCHPKVALQILQELPQLSQKSYANILLKLSLPKIRQLFMHDSFYFFLWDKTMALAGHLPHSKEQAILEVKCRCVQLNQPEQRVLYMVGHSLGSELFISALRVTASELLEDYISSKKFLIDLLQKTRSTLQQQSDRELNYGKCLNFLRNIKDAYYSLLLLPNSHQQTYEVLKVKDKQLFSKMFRSQCLSYISSHFDFYFNYHRDKLIEVLAFIAVENPQELWPQIISKRYSPQRKTHSVTQPSSEYAQTLTEQSSSISAGDRQTNGEVDNQSTFVLLMVNSFYVPGQPQWQMSCLVLQRLVRCHPSEAQVCLMRIFIETTKHSLAPEVVDLAIELLEQFQIRGRPDRRMELFLLQFISLVNCSIAQDYCNWENSRGAGRVMKPSIQSHRVISYLRLFTSIFKLRDTHVFQALECNTVLQQLLRMTGKCKGISEAVRRRLLREIETYLIGQGLEQQQWLQLSKSVSSGTSGPVSSSCQAVSKGRNFSDFLRSLIQK